MLKINKKLSPYNHSKGGNTLKYIVIHGTDNVNDTAKNNIEYFYRENRNASAHYFVDDDSIWQCVNDSDRAWHVGDGRGEYGITNGNSIGIEMCGTDNGRYSAKTVQNAIDLTKHLAAKYGIPYSNVVRHYDASRKNCPSQFSSNNWARWHDFKARLEGHSSTVIEDTPPAKSPIAVAAEFVGSRCKELQTKLIKLGYNCGSTGADGIFGEATYNAVKKFQKDHGLTVDGLAGKDTFAKLDEQLNKHVANSDRYKAIVKDLQTALNKQKGAKLVVDGIPGPATLNACASVLVKEGARGDFAKCVQRFLLDADISVGAYGADGAFGKDTTKAVKTFQSRKGIAADGIVGKATWQKFLRL